MVKAGTMLGGFDVLLVDAGTVFAGLAVFIASMGLRVFRT
jgi:hypothetical protein